MKTGSYGGYEIHTPTSGGKAGKGHNKTTSLQIRRPLPGGGSLLLKAFRFQTAFIHSRREASSKVVAWINQNPIIK